MTTSDDETPEKPGGAGPWGQILPEPEDARPESGGESFMKPGEVDRLLTKPETDRQKSRREQEKAQRDEAMRKKARDLRLAAIEQRRGMASDPFAEGYSEADRRDFDEESKRVDERVHMPRVIQDRESTTAPINSDSISEEELATFLTLLATKRAWNHSAYAIGRSGQYMRRYAQQDEWFRLACAEALQDYAESIEMEVHRRAVVGVEKPIFSQQIGEIIGYERTYSDMLLKVLLEGNVKKYKSGSGTNVNVNIGDDQSKRTGVMVVPGMKTPDAWRAELEQRTQPKISGPVKVPLKGND